MTDLEIFTKSASHLLKQNKLSMGTDHNCMYLSPTGEMCAVGCLINPTAYNKTIENATVDYEANDAKSKRLRTILTQSGIPNNTKTYGLLKRLQTCHDELEPENWEKRLAMIHSKFFEKSIEDSEKFVRKLK